MRNIRSTFRTAAVAASTLALITGLAVTTAAPANAVTGASISHSAVAKKAPKPELWLDYEVVKSGPIMQEYTVILDRKGKWKGPVTVTAKIPGVDDQVFTDVKNGQVLLIQVGPVGAGFVCNGLGWIEAKDTAKNFDGGYVPLNYTS